MTNQPDLYRDDPQRVIQAWRDAADTARVDPQFTPAERIKRAAYYTQQAERLERQEQAA
jgi:hypothetical protein